MKDFHFNNLCSFNKEKIQPCCIYIIWSGWPGIQLFKHVLFCIRVGETANLCSIYKVFWLDKIGVHSTILVLESFMTVIPVFHLQWMTIKWLFTMFVINSHKHQLKFNQIMVFFHYCYTNEKKMFGLVLTARNCVLYNFWCWV